MQLVGADYPVFTVTSSNQSINGRLGVGYGSAYVGTSTNHPFNIITNDNVKLTVTTSGNVGIGTSSPARLLDVNGTMRIADGSAIEWGGVSTAISGTSASNALLFSTSSSERMRITSSGNVGIGTTVPNTKLTVEGILASKPSGINAYYSYLKSSWTADNAFELGISDDGVTNFNKLITSSNYYFGTTLQFWTSNTERARFDGSGNFGIGTTSPSAKLDVIGGNIYTNGEIRIGTNYGTTGTGLIKSLSGVLSLFTWGDSSNIQIGGNDVIFKPEAGSERMRITSSGNVGIGTTSPSEKLHVNGNIKTSAPAAGAGTPGAFKIGQISSGVPTLINKLEVEIDGVTYYIPASIGTV
jgi:hypothetical protein